jgi:uncharacterized protein (UPF0332 family)
MFQWNNYLSIAKEMSKKDEEEFKRSAISRAYYSAFHEARSYLEGKGLSYKSRDNVHSYVWNSFAKFSGDARKISTKGDRLKYKRQQADYENEISGLNSLTNAAIQDAEFINQALQKMNN